MGRRSFGLTHLFNTCYKCDPPVWIFLEIHTNVFKVET